MKVEILVAIISAAAGVLGAVIAWAQAVRVNRLKSSMDISLERIKSETVLALETVKAENERRRKAFEVASQASAPIEIALGQAWQDMQTIKEVITKLLSPVRFDKDIALSSLGLAVASIEEGYSQHGANIPEPARSAWHKAKSCAGLVNFTVNDQDDVSSFSGPVVEALKNARRELTDQQIAIVASRDGLRKILVDKFLNII